LATWALAPGRWRISPLSTDIKRCEKEADNDDNSRCIGGTIAAHGSSDDLCVEGHAGPMCKLCVVANTSQHAAYFDEAQRRCKDCPTDTGARAGALVGGVVGVLVLAYILWCSWRRGLTCSCCETNKSETRWLTRLIRRVLFCVSIALNVFSRNIVPRFKIIVTYLQVAVVLPSLYGTEMPSEYDKWLDWLEVLKFDWSELLVPGACLLGGLKSRILLRGLGPLLLMLCPLVISIVTYMASYCRARIGEDADRTAAPFRDGFKAAALRALPYAIFISFCLNQSVSAGIFSAWDCVEFMYDPATSTTRSFLREELSVECDTDEHWQIQRVAYIFFAFWPVGMPLLYLLMLLPCRDALVEGRSTPLTRALSFLHQEYTGRYFWWEALFVLQRLMVIGFVMMFFPTKDAIWRILFGIYITIVYLSLLLVLRPYARHDLNFLAAFGAQLALGCTMINALCIRIFDDIQAKYDLDGAQQIMRFGDPSEIVGVTIAFFFFAPLIVLIRSTFDATVEARAHAKRISHTKLENPVMSHVIV